MRVFHYDRRYVRIGLLRSVCRKEKTSAIIPQHYYRLMNDRNYSMYVCMYVCMVITYSRVWINRVRLPILLVVS